MHAITQTRTEEGWPIPPDLDYHRTPESVLELVQRRQLDALEIDGVALGDGTPGRVAPRLREIYLDEMRKAAI